VEPATGIDDRPRLTAAGLSALLPGLGQLYNGRRTLGLRLLIPSLIVFLLVLLVIASIPGNRLAATLIAPDTLIAVLVLNVLVLAWRLLAVGQGFFDRRFGGKPGRAGIVGLVIIVALVALPHLVAGYYGWVAYGAFEKVFSGTGDGSSGDGGTHVGPSPDPGGRINILLSGVDAGPGRNHALTDTMIVVSIDPVGSTVSMVSVPRDMVDVPLGNGDTFAPKLNSLQSYATRHPDEFPNGAQRALPDAIGALLGIPIHYSAQVDLGGFVRMVDAVGGVDITVAKALSDPNYGGFGVGPGWSIKPGQHHLDGGNALAYARIRKSVGESDFTRAARQQQVLIALRDAAVQDNLLFSLPRLLEALGDTVRTDLPASRLPELAALAEEIGGDATTLVVIKSPLVHSGGKNHPYGSVQVPVVPAIQAMAKLVFPAPGIAPTPWPTPKPTKAPASPSPSP
jgi:LCP family protein required for cell wall assembly